jgi:hypothetical protein
MAQTLHKTGVYQGFRNDQILRKCDFYVGCFSHNQVNRVTSVFKNSCVIGED